ncbi:alpha/beta hydrolase [[Mycobacterium] nativiensis]|uniref:Alpha/beta hydrolase-fold protein n=1 Tax=[Mycobacterium] nativiensis TaxID=2855503 RepID=A0ABU5XYS4_9MYCO|nr:alpha/beta hydrolase-fold protein [Mycolicibacter sp. MYC340]MEB3033151.1 alpha/beta hydrolase-fold protein [Mycolicibacter sp. MYC340]
MHGWIPVTVQAMAVLALLLAVGWRSRRWLRRLPLIGGMGLAAAACAYWFVADDGLSGEPAPPALWMWIALTGAAAALLVLGWQGAEWWRRGVALLAVPLCLMSAGLTLNGWVGYFPTVQSAWGQLTSGPLPDQSDIEAVRAMAGSGTAPGRGRVLQVTIPADASHFKHRGELVYLPPAWFAQSPPPALPTVMMIGGEFNTPADWLRSGGAIRVIDEFAAEHDGNAPVLVFVDSGGSFNNDTECVNGPRGNAADHLTDDVVPYMISHFGVSSQASHWGVVGWSMGGTCAVDLTTMHPDKFSAFVDIAGDLSPNAGTRAQTIARLFGGSVDAWAAFDPSTVIAKHGRYSGVSGWFAVNGSATTADTGGQLAAAKSLCALGQANGIDCAVVTEPGKHDWPFAGKVFADSLPWLAGQVGTPGVQPAPFPGASSEVTAAGPPPARRVHPAGR